MIKPNKLEQYKRLLDAATNNKLGANTPADGCAYAVGNRRCAVGFMFNSEQLADIERRGLNRDTSINQVAREIGYDNIEQVTGFTVEELLSLQEAHDGSPSLASRKRADRVNTDFVAMLHTLIDKEQQ